MTRKFSVQVRRLAVAALLCLALGLLSTRPSMAQQPSDRTNLQSLFRPAGDYDSGGSLAWTVAVADVNGDGAPDILAMDYSGYSNGDGSIAVLLNVGSGQFVRDAVYDSGGEATSGIAVGDLRSNGKIDVVVTSQVCPAIGASCIGVLLSNGDGTFQPVTIYADDGQNLESGEGIFYTVAIADVNKDGKPDIIAVNQTDSNYGDGRVAVFLGNGDGTFQPVVTYSSGGFAALAATVADINGDGKLDVLVFNCAPHGSSTCARGTIGVLLGNGDGTFEPAKTYSSGGLGGGSALLVTDVNGDGKPDIVVGNNCPGNCTGIGTFAVLLNSGNGTFSPPVTYPTGTANVFSIAAGDLNGDGQLDLVVMGVAASVWLGNGDGSFRGFRTYQGGFQGLLADLNGDHKLDLVAVNNTSGTADVRMGNGDGTFGSRQSYTIGGQEFSWLIVTDVNGDGQPDLVSANWCPVIMCRAGGSAVTVLLNTTTSPNSDGLWLGKAPQPSK